MKPIFWCCILLSLNGYAQTWQPLPMHGGGYVTGLMPHPTDANTLWARIDVAGVFKTNNGGNSWTAMTQTLPKTHKYNYYVRSFAMPQNDTARFYFLSGSSPYDDGSITHDWLLWKTADGGNSWTKTVAPFAVSGNGRYRHAGETLVVSPTNAQLLYAIGQPSYHFGTSSWNTNSGLWQYNTATNLWTQLDGGTLAQAWGTALRFDPDDANILWIAVAQNNQFGAASAAAGLWKYHILNNTLTQVRTEEVIDFDFDAQGADTMITIQQQGIDWTFDGGATWNGTVAPFPNYDYHYFVTAHPSQAGRWLFGYWQSIGASGILETTDCGANFYDAKYNQGTNKTKINFPAYANDNYKPSFGNATASLLFHPAAPQDVYVSDWYGVFKSTDGNLPLIAAPAAANTENANWAWTWQTKGIYNTVQVRTTPHPTDDDLYFSCLADIGAYQGDAANGTAVYQATHPITSIYQIKFATQNPSVGYMAGVHFNGKGRIVKTTDGGATWVEANSNFIWGTSFFESNNAAAVTDIAIANGLGDTLVVGIEKGSLPSQIYRSTDGGLSYHAWDAGLSISFFKTWTTTDRLLQDANGQTFYVWHQNQLFRRHLADATWAACVNPSGNVWFGQVVCDPVQTGVLYATQYNNKLYKSTDFGSTWTSITTSLINAAQFALSKNGTFAIIDNGNPNTSKVQTVFVSNNDGATWTQIGMAGVPTLFDGLDFTNNQQLIGWGIAAATYDLTTLLPLQLLDFEALCKTNSVLLKWTTVTEHQVLNIEIQRKTTGEAWQNIGTLPAKGGTTATVYELEDATLTATPSYYRLKINDLDGHFEYSNTIVTNCTVPDFLIKIYPNPSKGIYKITSAQPLKDLTIHNTAGQLVFEKKAINTNDNTLDLSLLQQGIYFVTATTTAGKRQVVKIWKN